MGKSLDLCEFRQIEGKVRDCRDVGVKQCSDCKLILHGEDLSKMVNYKVGSMHSWLSNSLDALPKAKADISRRVESIEMWAKEVSGNKLLDFGCGNGDFLRALPGTFSVFGLEPDDAVCRRNKSTIICETNLLELKKHSPKFDIITLFHVVEHLYQPTETIGELHSLLSEDGLLIVETPNAQDALTSLYQCRSFQDFTYWSHHPYVYSKIALSSLIERCGFKVLSTSGVQRYSLDNHMMWLSHGKPGGHETWGHIFDSKLLAEYARNLVNQDFNDTLYIVAKKV